MKSGETGNNRTSNKRGDSAGIPVRPVLIASEHTVYEYTGFMQRLVVGLSDDSIPCIIICPRSCFMDIIEPPGVEIIRYPFYEIPLMWRQNSRFLVEKLSDFKPTVLHSLCESKAIFTRQISRRMSLPYIVTVNSVQSSRWKVSISSRRCAGITVPSPSIKSNLERLFPRYAERVRQINIGTFVETTDHLPLERNRIPTMITTFPLRRVGDFEKLFGAIRHLVIEGYEFMFVVSSEGRAERELRKLLKGLGLLQYVIIVPRSLAWRSILGAGDIYIEPKPSKAFDPLLLQAMSAGCAVVGCAGGANELIINGKTGMIIDSDDELSIYNCLQRLFDAPEVTREMAEKARQYVRENHKVSTMVSEFIQLYQTAGDWRKS